MLKGFLIVGIWAMLFACNSENTEETQAAEEVTAKKDSSKAVAVSVIEVKTKKFVETHSFYGSVEGSESALLVSYTGGLVNKVKVKNGDKVSKGQSLCSIESEKYVLLYETAELNKKLASEEFERAKTHFEAGSFSQTQLDAAQQKLLAAKNQEIEARKNKNASLCISPISGIATEVIIEPYQNLVPGAATIHVSDIKNIKIEVGIPENEISGFVKGADAKIKHPRIPDSSYAGQVETITARVRPSDKNFIAEIKLKNPNQELKPGQTVEVVLSKVPMEDAIVLPSEVILNLENGNAVMAAVDGKARKITVEKGPANALESVILSGLNPGDKIISKGQMLVVDGSPIQVEKM